MLPSKSLLSTLTACLLLQGCVGDDMSDLRMFVADAYKD